MWPENESPYVPVARITALPQDTWSDALRQQVEDRLAFNPWTGLAAHRPLGSIMRARRPAYAAARAYRAENNAVTIDEPTRPPRRVGSPAIGGVGRPIGRAPREKTEPKHAGETRIGAVWRGSRMAASEPRFIASVGSDPHPAGERVAGPPGIGNTRWLNGRGTISSSGSRRSFFLASARSRGAPRNSIQAFHDEAKRPGFGRAGAPRKRSGDLLATDRQRRRGTRRPRRSARQTSGDRPVARPQAVRRRHASHRGLVRPEGDRQAALPRDDGRPSDHGGAVRWSPACMSTSRCRSPRRGSTFMRRIYPFLPLLLALSTSSPFYDRRRTGLHGYRLRAYAELPRTGLPELFDDADDYARYVRVMTGGRCRARPNVFLVAHPAFDPIPDPGACASPTAARDWTIP